jgi:GNAT superfamily N-acetyltransferase
MSLIAGRIDCRLRDVTAADEPFLRALYAEAHGAELAGLPPGLRESLLDLQFRARVASYAAYSTLTTSIVLVGEEPVGHLVVGMAGGSRHLVDIALVHGHRGRGIGTELLRCLISDADRDRLPLTLNVAHGSPARHLYERLGFVACGEIPFRVVMRREPLQAPSHALPVSSTPLTRSTS